MVNTKSILKVLNDEIEFYNQQTKNYMDLYDNGVNDGFKLALKYCKELIETMERTEIKS